MKTKIPFHCLLSLAAPAALFAGVTAINNGTHEWADADWTAGPPGQGDTAFLNDNTVLVVPAGVEAFLEGVRIGNVTSSTAVLQLDGGALEALFVVVGDAPASNAEFVVDSGALRIIDTAHLDFQFGKAAAPTGESCAASAVFSGGSADLADVVFNLSAGRNSVLRIVGTAPQVAAFSLSADPAGSGPVTPAMLAFDLNASGVSPLEVSGEVALGDGDQFVLQVNGSAYAGGPGRMVLVDGGSLNGAFVDIELTGFAGNAAVETDSVAGDVILLVE